MQTRLALAQVVVNNISLPLFHMSFKEPHVIWVDTRMKQSKPNNVYATKVCLHPNKDWEYLPPPFQVEGNNEHEIGIILRQTAFPNISCPLFKPICNNMHAIRVNTCTRWSKANTRMQLGLTFTQAIVKSISHPISKPSLYNTQAVRVNTCTNWSKLKNAHAHHHNYDLPPTCPPRVLVHNQPPLKL